MVTNDLGREKRRGLRGDKRRREHRCPHWCRKGEKKLANEAEVGGGGEQQENDGRSGCAMPLATAPVVMSAASKPSTNRKSRCVTKSASISPFLSSPMVLRKAIFLHGHHTARQGTGGSESSRWGLGGGGGGGEAGQPLSR